MVEIAIIIPVWRHSVLVSEAIASCIAQKNAPDFRIVVVNDGCDHKETAQTLEGWRRAYPDQISVLTQVNQGLSAARNTGIDYALKTYENAKAVYFLDADNRLDSHALALFSQLLSDPSDAAWFYPQFDMFGMAANKSNGGDFSLARLAISNICEAGSLVKREMLDAGLRFDTDFRAGFEDWDFWLSAAQKGFKGAPVPHSFFRYRKRPESMISAAMYRNEELKKQLRDKHSWLYGRQELMKTWSEEWPRFALIGTNGIFSVGSDLDTQKAVSQDEFIQQVFAHQVQPDESRLPLVVIFYQSDALEDLYGAKILDSCLHQIEGALLKNPLVGLRLKNGPLCIKPNRDQVHWVSQVMAECNFFAMSAHHLCAASKKPNAADALAYLIDVIRVSILDVSLPDVQVKSGVSRQTVTDFVNAMMDAPAAKAAIDQFKNWRGTDYYPLTSANIAEQNAGGRPALSFGNRPSVGFVVPIFHFGGVEKCVVALATTLKNIGIDCHLFIYGNETTRASDWMYEPFEKIWMLTEDHLISWDGKKYLGTGTSKNPGATLLGDVIGPLTAMNVVVNCGSNVLHRCLQALRAKGVKTATWLHLIEGSEFNRANGHPFLAVGYEAGYDQILTCSNQLSHQMAGHGVPRAKLLAMPNGPGYPTQNTQRETQVHGPLRVGFLGRFDHQKGLDRFVSIARKLRDGPFDFHIRGGSVLNFEAEIPDWLNPQRPIFAPSELDAFFASIDVLVLPSRDEGLPLTILEAQRAGVVVIASDVGAVSEAVEHRKTGYLLPANTVIESAVAALQHLATNPETLRDIASNAAGKPDNWPQNAAAFVKHLFD